MWAARLVVFAAFFDLFVQFPTMAPHARNLGASAALVGIVVAAYSMTNLFGNLGAGFVLDRWGRRGPIIIGLAITALAVLSYAFVRTPEQLLVARAIHGIGAAALTPGAFSIIGDWVASDQRGRAMGLAGAMIAIPAMIGPPVAGFLRDAWGADSVFFLDAAVLAITLIAFAAVTRGLPYKAARRVAQSAADGAATPIGRLMLSANATLFAVTIGVGVLVAHLPLVLESQGESAARSGFSFAIFALVAILVMASPVGGASDRMGRFVPLLGGLVGVAAGLAVLGVAEDYGVIAAGMAVFGLGYGLVFPAATALVTESAGPGRRGMAFGIFYAVYSLGVAIGSAGSGRLAEFYEEPMGLPFFVAAVIVLVAVPIVGVFRRQPVAR
ncbi:MAG: MFS transporter [Chloroflexi bacterium]|nr:MFS transporter [Chloroflexota bacterium]